METFFFFCRYGFTKEVLGKYQVSERLLLVKTRSHEDHHDNNEDIVIINTTDYQSPQHN